jgi:hypothetical protein
VIRKLLLIATAGMVFVAPASAAESIPDYLVGHWCQTVPGTVEVIRQSEVDSLGDFVKAKTVCKADRPMVFTFHRVGFSIKVTAEPNPKVDYKAPIMCVPIKVESYAHGWLVVADCGTSNLSIKPQRIGFAFESFELGKMSVTRWPPHPGRDY